MSTGTKHTISAFDDDMDEIRGLIAEMGARAEAAVVAAMKALRATPSLRQPLQPRPVHPFRR